MSEKSLKLILVICCLLHFVQYSNNKKDRSEVSILTNRVDSLQKLSDSLAMELFPVQVELGRYEVAYQILMERNPKAANQYGTIISEETE